MKGQGRKGTAVFALTERGLALSEKIAGAVEGAEVFAPGQLVDGGLRQKAQRAFNTKGALVFISAVGIAVRCCAPLLRGKQTDPAVVVVDERGRFAVSLLSGHLGGANRLAKRIASAIGAAAVITTATDLWGLPSVEDLAERLSLSIEDPGLIKAVNSAILEGRRVVVADRDLSRRKAVREDFLGVFACRASLPEKLAPGEAAVLVTSRLIELPKALARRTLVLRPRDIVAGIGCGRGASKAEIKDALETAFRKAGLSTLSIARIATIDLKKNERGLVALAKELSVPVETWAAERLRAVRCPSGPSKAALAATGAGAISEPAALLSSGARRLCLKKTKKGRVTIAAAYLG